ncbi:MAG: ferredoxin--NADP reductase [Marinoscillum sp.]|uniref:2Fe-2S iron-sulfur cluster-binding protein n=1 Tax=Marinoscillum sp. TaxID=2024838 RepID=UPI0033022EB0
MKTRVKIEKVIRETSDAFTLVLENAPSIGSYLPGQFLNFFLDINGEEVVRQYSFSSSALIGEPPAVTIKKVAGGLASNFLGEHLRAGDEVSVSTPSGRFTTTYGERRRVLMVAGGSGITPLYSMMKSILAREPESQVTLLYANRSSESIIFKAGLDYLEQKYHGRLEVKHFLSAEDAGPEKQENTVFRKLNRFDFQKYVDAYWKESPEVFICGPDSLMDLSVVSLSDLGLSDDRIRVEAFTGTGGVENTNDASEACTQVEIRDFNGGPVAFRADRNQPVLKSALDAGIRLPHSCKESMCGACKVKLISGQLHMKTNYALPDDELEQGYVLLCSGFPQSEKLALQYG